MYTVLTICIITVTLDSYQYVVSEAQQCTPPAIFIQLGFR